MAMMGLLPMAAKKLRKKVYRPLAMLSPAAMAMGMHKKDKMKSMQTMKGGGMNRANMNKQMSYKGGGMNPGMMALKQERPDVAKKMGFTHGGKVKMMGHGGKIKYKHSGGVHSCPVDGVAKNGKTREKSAQKKKKMKRKYA